MMPDEKDEEKKRFTWKEKMTALGRQLRPFRGMLITLSILGVLSAAANGVVPFIIGKFFDALVTPHMLSVPLLGTFAAWAVLLSLWALVQIIANGVSWFIDRKSRLLTTEIEAGIQSNAFVTLLTLPISFHKQNRAGEITDIVSKAGWMLSNMTSTIMSLAPQFLTIIIGIAISFYLRPSLAWVLLGGVAVYLIVLVRVLPSTARYQEEGFRIWNRAYGDAADAYTNVQTVKQAGAEEYEKKRILAGFYDKAVPIWYRMQCTWSNLNFSQRIIVTLTQTAIFIFSCASRR